MNEDLARKKFQHLNRMIEREQRIIEQSRVKLKKLKLMQYQLRRNWLELHGTRKWTQGKEYLTDSEV